MDLVSTAGFSLRELSTLFTRTFEGYYVPWPDAPALLDARIRGEAISLADSRVAIAAEGPAALLLVSRRGRESRLAAIGIAPAFRGRTAYRSRYTSEAWCAKVLAIGTVGSQSGAVLEPGAKGMPGGGPMTSCFRFHGSPGVR